MTCSNRLKMRTCVVARLSSSSSSSFYHFVLLYWGLAGGGKTTPYDAPGGSNQPLFFLSLLKAIKWEGLSSFSLLLLLLLSPPDAFSLCSVSRNNKEEGRRAHFGCITFDISTTKAPTAVVVCNHNNKASPKQHEMQPVRRPAKKKKRLGVYCFSCRETKINGGKNKTKRKKKSTQQLSSSAPEWRQFRFIFLFPQFHYGNHQHPATTTTTKLNALFWFAGVGGRPIIFIVPGQHQSDELLTRPEMNVGNKKKKKCARWSIHHTHKNNKKTHKRRRKKKTKLRHRPWS